jgi:uncharacterized membrane protein YidH (DUF202 family)
VSVAASLWGALAIAVFLALAHLLVPHVRRLPFVPERAMASFAGGVAVSYVFLHLLPELAEGNESVAKALKQHVEPTPLLDLGIFLVGLMGLLVFYGLERIAVSSTNEQRDPSGGVFALHLGSFCVYNAIITYTMPLRLRTGVAFALLFAAAMALHFLLVDRSLRERFPLRFTSRGRFILAGALIVGWIAAVLAAPTSVLVVSIITAFLGGSVVFNVFKEELPSDRGSSFMWFAAGLGVYAVILSITTFFSER